MKKLFGTDGLRGEAGHFPLDVDTVRVVGRSLAKHLMTHLGRNARIVTGRDTRESGGRIERAFIEGALGTGAVCSSAGVITTPGVAFLTRALPADAGVVISASHNPFKDNGIKVFAPTGQKLDDAMERLIEADIFAAAESKNTVPEPESLQTPAGEQERNAASLRARYINYLAEEVAAGLPLDGVRLIIDCANGAASDLAPTLFERLGADTIAINNRPDGRNINQECGSLHIAGLRRAVIENGAALGVALDGDADRALFIDARGQLVDGDATLWVMAQHLAAQGRLAGDCVVATVMSNIGLEIALRSRKIALLRTDVGDKFVLDELLRTGASVGGEQSGHIIFPHVSLAGDGMSTTIHLLRAMHETGLSLHELTEGFVRYPQVLLNVRVREKRHFHEVKEIAKHAREVEGKLAGKGRLLLRYSGTEPLARIMIEGERQDEIELLASSLAMTIENTLGVS